MIIRVSENDLEKYESFVSGHPSGHFMQSLRWASFKKNQKSFAIMSVDDSGEVQGAMLLFLQDVRRTKKKILYSPRGPVCSRSEVKVLEELLEEAGKIAKEIGAYKLTFDADITDADVIWIEYLRKKGARIGDNSLDNAILQPFSVYRINVDKDDDTLMESYHSKARYSVRTAIKSEAVCRIGTKEDIPVFCELLASTALRDGFTPRKESYFSEMFDALGEDCFKLFIVECGGEAIAGSVLLRYGKKTWHMYAGSNDKFKETLPNFLMQWEMMRWSRDNGCSLYDMRGIAGEGDKLTPIEGLVRFKKRFGGELCSFIGRIDIVYNKFSDCYVKMLKRAAHIVRMKKGMR